MKRKVKYFRNYFYVMKIFVNLWCHLDRGVMPHVVGCHMYYCYFSSFISLTCPSTHSPSFGIRTSSQIQ